MKILAKFYHSKDFLCYYYYKDNSNINYDKQFGLSVYTNLVYSVSIHCVKRNYLDN